MLEKLYNSGLEILRIRKYRLRMYSDWSRFSYSDYCTNVYPREKIISLGFFTLTIGE